ncbi:MAG: HemK family protein methyltransferase [Candidatus Paceibacterota bacterium]|jgi:release factor glutamine methyltransferase
MESTDNDEPLAYQIGDQPFLGLTIYLDSQPLIPRPETEWWTEQLLTNVGRRTSYIKFLDLCSGSGAIGCAALAKLPNAQVYFGEIDPAHEATILKNIRKNNLDESPAFAEASAGKRAHICIGDLFEPFGDMKFDVIAANPPYIPDDRELPASVADYEPALALRSGADGLDLIRRIANSVRCHLTDAGVAWIECDSPTAEDARKLFEDQGFKAEILLDQYDQPRVVCIKMI